MSNSKPNAWLSYSHEDSAFALRLAGDLRAAGADIRMDEGNPAGSWWDNDAARGLRECSHVVVILSPSAMKSENVLDELSFAFDQRKIVIPLMHADCDVFERLKNLDCVDCRSDYSNGVKGVVAALAQAAEDVDRPARFDYRSWPESMVGWEAFDILRGARARQVEIFRLAKALKNRWKRFGVARRLLGLARSAESRVTDRDPGLIRKLCQQHALCTYKDPDLPAEARFDRAVAILNEADLSAESDPRALISQETLGIAGAIFKGQWEAFGQRRFLDRSLSYYRRGWQQGSGDDGYTGINTAYLMDLIAFQEEAESQRSGMPSPQAALRRDEARKIRETLLVALQSLADSCALGLVTEPPSDSDVLEGDRDRLYWILVTLGEACVGLGLYDDDRFQRCKEFFAKARGLDRYDWMVESTARQVAALSHYLPAFEGAQAEREAQRPKEALACLVGDETGVRNAFVGRVGLALSGGGFRAALFHIGVLARLAELDMLRHVEYLSCVSGGSIIGAYLYLELRNLLESKTDKEIKAADYIEMVARIELNFLAGVQQNVRMRSLSSYGTNFKHDILTGALPTERVGQLYEELLYSRVAKSGSDVGMERYLSELQICPPVADAARPRKDFRFRPKDHNWKREHKVPVLVLNATTLNTGHNWQFTSTWMGEPPSSKDNEIDANQRLRRMYYDEAPEKYQEFRLGRAVGASSCVPALFSPVEMPGLYPDATDPKRKDLGLKLVDGGVHDNQGVSSLLDQGCTVMLVSDASGQLADQADPGLQLLSTAMRADEIAQERVRVAQYQDLQSRVRSGLLRSVMFLHLKHDLKDAPLYWLECKDQDIDFDDGPPRALSATTCYGVHRDVQRRLAAVRTDLDAFHDLEAWALMASAYAMTECCFPKELREVTQADSAKHEWRFLRVQPEMESPSDNFLKVLSVSSQIKFKVWQLNPGLHRFWRILYWVGLIAMVGLCASGLWFESFAIVSSRTVAKSVAGILVMMVLTKLVGASLADKLNVPGRLKKVLRRSLLALGFYCLAWVHLLYLDKKYLEAGRVGN